MQEIKAKAIADGIFMKAPNINFLTTPQGEVYGFEHKGTICVFSPDYQPNGSTSANTIDPTTPIHEYTHLWDSVVQRVNPEFWAKGIQLMKTEAKNPWVQIANDPNYGQKWQSQGKSQNEIDNLSDTDKLSISSGFYLLR